MRVEFAYPHTDEDGKSYEPDQSAELDDEVAQTLIRDGKVRPAADAKADSSDDTGSADAEAKTKTRKGNA